MESALVAQFRTLFGREPALVTRAPGRIEFIGNHTDYNGGTVLGAAIDRSIWVAVAPRSDANWNFATAQRAGVVHVAVADFAKLRGAASWANYPLGILDAMRTAGLRLPAGFDFLAMSDLPLGAGLSSSAAIEMASVLAMTKMTNEAPTREALVKLAKQAENNFVGVPCGILDQGVSGFGRRDHLVFIDCRGPRFETVPLPPGAHFWIFNTHTKHALVDGLYAARHRECMEAARTLGVPLLVDASPASVLAAEGKLSPSAFKRARHIVEEIARVDATVLALRRGDLGAVGQLLTASHRSSQRLFENSTAELDFLVDTLVGTPHVYGARLTGGGFGGAVMAMTSEAFGETAARDVASRYAEQFAAKPDVLHTRTGDGAAIVR
jgi:galactokinase